MGRLIFYILATSYLRRGRRDVKLRGQDVFRRLFAEWDETMRLLCLTRGELFFHKKNLFIIVSNPGKKIEGVEHFNF